jgi:quercetin dioxygenase-like cupin family protein
MMRICRLALASLVWSTGWCAHGQALDPLVADPGHYHLDLENQWVRVIREHMGPRETMPMHQHPAPGAVIVFLTDRHNRLISQAGVSQELRNHAGDLMWSPASTHRSENLNDAPFEAVQIEPRVPAASKAETPSFSDPLDATRVDPKHYHVELENEYVRVLRVTIGPHEKLALHKHPDTGAVLVHLTDQNLRLTSADGTVRESRYKAGQIHWAPPAAAHQDENLSVQPLRFIRVELKKAVP